MADTLKQPNQFDSERTTCVTCGLKMKFSHPLPLCPRCGLGVCFQCRDLGRHVDTTAEYNFGFCLQCFKPRRWLLRDGKLRCPDCDFEWTPSVIKRLDKPGEYICPFCGAQQQSSVVPFYCGCCAMELR